MSLENIEQLKVHSRERERHKQYLTKMYSNERLPGCKIMLDISMMEEAYQLVLLKLLPTHQ